MDIETIVERYIEAWNNKDAAGVMSLMHNGAAYYDAYWTESRVGRDLETYISNAFEDDRYWYKIVGEVIHTETSTIFRYHAFDSNETGDDQVVFNGAEVLSIRDDKVVTVCNYYCDPDQAALLDLAEFSERRHGEARYAKLGLGATKYMRISRDFGALLDRGELNTEPVPTASEVAKKIDCSMVDLFQVLKVANESEFRGYLISSLED